MTKSSTRASIVDAAVAVAARRGISGSSMDEIAEQAGVAKGSLYYHFDSKDAIFTEVLRLGLERVVAAVDDARAGAQLGRRCVLLGTSPVRRCHAPIGCRCG